MAGGVSACSQIHQHACYQDPGHPKVVLVCVCVSVCICVCHTFTARCFCGGFFFFWLVGCEQSLCVCVLVSLVCCVNCGAVSFVGLQAPIREREGGDANVNGGRHTKCDTLNDMDIYSEKLILTLNTECHFM